MITRNNKEFDVKRTFRVQAFIEDETKAEVNLYDSKIYLTGYLVEKKGYVNYKGTYKELLEIIEAHQKQQQNIENI